MAIKKVINILNNFYYNFIFKFFRGNAININNKLKKN